MARDIDDVVGAPHDEDIAVGVDEAGIRGVVEARIGGEIGFDEALLGLPQSRQGAGRQRQLDHDRAHRSGRHGPPALVDALHVVARHRHRRRARLHREQLEPERIADDRRAGLGLPPMVDHRHLQDVLRPDQRVGVGPLASQEQRPELREVIGRQQRRVGILLADRAEGRRGREQHHRLVLGDQPPEGAGIGRAHRLALIEHRGRALDQRRIDDVAVADDPADIRRRDHHLARLHAVEIVHRPFQRDQMAAIVAHHALGPARRAGCVEDVERVGRRDGNALRPSALCLGGGDQHAPVLVAGGVHRGFDLRPLQDQAGLRLVRGQLDRLVEQRLVFDDAAGLDAAGRGQDHLGRRILDPRRQFLGREAAEHHRMHRADAGAGEHGEGGFRYHRHVEDDAVALGHAEILQDRREGPDLVQHLRVAVDRLAAGDRAVMDQRRLLTAPVPHMAVERVEAGVAGRVREPAAIGALTGVEDALRRRDPVDRLRGFSPEALGIGLPARISLLVTARLGHRTPSPALFL